MTQTPSAVAVAAPQAMTQPPSSGNNAAVSSSSYYAFNSASQWKKQLITKEDPNHVHKTLGICVLLSYIWRLSQVGDSDLGFLTHRAWTVPTLLLHLALNASSFEFKLPAKRISSGYRIWPEYRLHSLVFLCRSLAMMLLFWVEQGHFNNREFHVWNIVIVLSTMAAADLSSHSSDVQSGFARELDVPAIVKYFFSMAQIYATSMILTGHRRYTMQFLMVIIVQGNAFLMTIRRKNLASHAVLTSIYGASIVGAGIIAWFEFQNRAGWPTFRGMVLCANLALVLRTGPRVIPVLSIVQNNKYLLWLAMYAIQETYIRPNLLEPLTVKRQCVNLASVAAMVGLGVYKHLQEKRQISTSSKKAT